MTDPNTPQDAREALYLVTAGGDGYHSEIVPASRLDDAYLLTQWGDLDGIDPEQRTAALEHFHDPDEWLYQDPLRGPEHRVAVEFSVSFEDGWVRVQRLPALATAAPAPQQAEGAAEDLSETWIQAVAIDCGLTCDRLSVLFDFARRVERATRLAQPAPQPGLALCDDCGRQYGDEHGFPDLVIENAIWRRISPTGDDGGLLCPSCICAALHKAGISRVEAAFMSGPIESVTSPTMRAIRMAENLQERLDKLSQPEVPPPLQVGAEPSAGRIKIAADKMAEWATREDMYSAQACAARGTLFDMIDAALAAQVVAPQPQSAAAVAWQGLTESECAHFVGQIEGYGTEFVTPLFAVLANVEKLLKDRNAASPEAHRG